MPAHISEAAFNPVEYFVSVTAPEIQHIHDLQRTLIGNLALTADLDQCNQIFRMSGRPDLQVTQRVPMRPITLDDTYEGDNFSTKFQMYTGREPKDPALGIYDTRPPISITREELEACLDGERNPAQYDLSGSHLTTESYLRMAIVDRPFTIGLTLLASDPANHHRLGEYRRDLFVALVIMASLTDYADERQYGVQAGTFSSWRKK